MLTFYAWRASSTLCRITDCRSWPEALDLGRFSLFFSNSIIIITIIIIIIIIIWAESGTVYNSNILHNRVGGAVDRHAPLTRARSKAKVRSGNNRKQNS